MKICAATMARDFTECKDAWESAESLVDEFVHYTAGEITDFSESRNTLLQHCADIGCDWALMLDTDERIHPRGPLTTGDGLTINWPSLHDTMQASDLKNVLAECPHDMLHVWADDHSYAKPRLFRLPAKGKYVGPTHEAWVADPGSTTGTLEGITFSELPKSEEQYRAKVERDRTILEAYTQEHPDDPRWWFYLGDTYSGLGMDDEAMNAFAQCWGLNGWDEESAWAAYRFAEICCKREDYKGGLNWSTAGMERHPGMAELPWLAGYCCYKMGRYQHAIWWEEMAIALNKAKSAEHRINFRHEPALWEGPYDVMSHANAALGKDVRSSADRVLCEAYMGERLKSQKSRAT